jgi:hypothetical protein
MITRYTLHTQRCVATASRGPPRSWSWRIGGWRGAQLFRTSEVVISDFSKNFLSPLSFQPHSNTSSHSAAQHVPSPLNLTLPFGPTRADSNEGGVTEGAKPR